MLRYNHVFNTNLDYPFHIHVIESSSTSVSIGLNNVTVGTYKPTLGRLYSFQKYNSLQASILELMVVGSRQNYDRYLEAAIFKDSMIKYIKDVSGRFLVLDNTTGQYYWSYTDRTRFFFNPKYFSSEVLWNKTVGYIPTGEQGLDIWDSTTANNLFLAQNYIVELDETWSGSKVIEDVDPVTVNSFNNDTEGLLTDYYVSEFIEDLQDLKDGDVITIDNGIDRLSITVENCWTEASYPLDNVTDRPIMHVPIDIVNPNKRVNYSKTMEMASQETISMTLYSNNIQFNITRT